MNDWDDIRYFLSVAKTGSVTAASRELGVNHSTVSRRIKALEKRHGVRLFDQLRSGYKITDQAADVFELALEIEALSQSFSRKLLGLDSRLQGPVNITMPHDIFEFFFVQHLAEFQQRYPNISINMLVAKGLKDLAAREADIAVRLSSNPPDYLVGRKICNLAHGIYHSNDLALSDHTRTPVIAWTDQIGIPDWAIAHVHKPFIALKVNDLLAMYKAVEQGLGVARMPAYMHNMYKSNHINVLPVNLPKSPWGVWLLSHVDLRNTLRVQTCREYIFEKLESSIELFEKT